MNCPTNGHQVLRLVPINTVKTQPARESQIARFGKYASEERDFWKLLDRAVAVTTACLDLDRCAILKLSDRRDSFQIVANVGWNETAVPQGAIAAGVRSQEGYTLSSGRPVSCRDLSRETRFRPSPVILSQRLVSSISVVIDGDSSPFGVLAGYTQSERRFSQVDVDFMESVALILAAGLRRMHSERDRARLAAVADCASDAVIGTTTEGTIFSWNRAAEEMYGFSKADVIGRQMTMLFPPDGAPQSKGRRPHDDRVVGPYETVCRRRDGALIDVEIRMAPIDRGDGRAVANMMTVRDISSNIRQERALRTHAGVLQQLQLGVVICRLEDPDDVASLRLLLANPAGADAAGFPLDGAIGRRLVEVCPDATPSGYLARYAEVARTARAHDFGECVIAGPIPPAASAADAPDSPTSTPRVFRVRAFPLPDQCVGVVFHDVTTQHQLAAQLRQAQRLELIGHLTAGVAHDFNNWLTVIGGYADLLNRAMGLNPAMRQDLEEIKQAADAASALSRQLLTFTRRHASRPTPVELGALLSRMKGMLQRLIGEDIALILMHPEGEAIVHADVGHLEQIMLNLAANARDAMPTGGQLTIDTEVVGMTPAQARRRKGVEPGCYVKLTVADTGAGIDRSIRDRIFEPFFTTKEAGKGTGLGLSTVLDIVKESRGHIEVESEPGEGSVFKVYLPLAHHVSLETSNPQNVGASPTGSETILVVEDEDPVRTLLAGLLTNAGYKVLTAATPVEALEMVKRNTGSIDLLLTDVVMPQLSGPDLADRLRTSKPGLRVLCMSGYPADLIARRGVHFLKEPFLPKPFAPHDLLTAVRGALEHDAAGAAGGTAPAVQRGGS